MIHLFTAQKHQVHGYRYPVLLSQTAYYRPCKMKLVHYRVCGATAEHLSELMWCRTAANVCLDLSYRIRTSLLPVESTAPLSVPYWQVEPTFSLPTHSHHIPCPHPTHQPPYTLHT